MDKGKNWNIVNSTLEDVVKLSKEILDSIDGKPVKFPIQQATFFDFAIRSHGCIEATNLLWKPFAQKTFYKFPIAIQLRVGVLDFLTFAYLFEFRKDQDKFSSEVDRLNQSFYSWVSKHIDDADLEAKSHADELLKEHFPRKYDLSGNKVKVKSQVVSDMAKEAAGGELGEYVPTAYNIYRLLSQYEHYSEVSRKFMLRPIEFDIEQFLVGLDCVLLLQYFCFQLLEIDEQLMGKYSALYHGYVRSYGDGRVIEIK